MNKADMDKWDGTTERRTDDTSARILLLEHCHQENQASLVSVHKRISKMEDTLVVKLDAIMDDIALYRTETTKLQNDVKWLKGWVGSAWAAITAGIGLLLYRKS